MPISQDDMIKVIEAGLHFRQAHLDLQERLTDFSKDILKALHNNRVEEAMVKWDIFYEASMNPPPKAVEDSVLLLTKYEHYRKFYRNNVLHKAQMARRRAANTAGKSLTDLIRDPITNLTPAQVREANALLEAQLEEARQEALQSERYRDLQTLSEAEFAKKYPYIPPTDTPFDGQTPAKPLLFPGAPTKELDIFDVNAPSPPAKKDTDK